MQHVYRRNALRSQHQHLAAVRRSQPCARRLFVNSTIIQIHWHMNNRRILAFIRCMFNDRITRHDDGTDTSYLKTPKVKKLIFPKWRLLTGLDMNVDWTSKDVVYDHSTIHTGWHGMKKQPSTTNGSTRSQNFTIIPYIQLVCSELYSYSFFPSPLAQILTITCGFYF